MVHAQPHSVWAAVLAAASFFTFTPQTVAAQNCHCYLTNGSSPAYYARQQFFDFRNIANPKTPAAISDRTAAQNAPVTHAYFNTSAWSNFWSIQAWVDTSSDSTVYNTYSKNDVYIATNTDAKPASKTYLALRTYRHPAQNGNFQSSAEIQTVSPNYRYVSMRMYSRTRGAKGAVSAMFTYRGGDTAADVQEADLEMLTNNATNQIHYTNQPSSAGGVSRPNSTAQISIPGVWTNWRTHRYDWTPGNSNWYVDGKLVESNTFQAPVDPATLLFNVWSDGGSWSGVMPSGQTAEMDIQWIEILYNNTAQPSAYAHCANVCSLDRSSTPGTPVVISSGP
ncbi:glycoside hydrolase family 16 protein [Hypoxylon sp. CI-4A]|nr:glycoside hydrolase family 16 protein [Hypoxylon sp. CI-4A]